MSSDPKNFTAEERAAIALKAQSGDPSAKQELAEKHGITVEEIEKWIRETGSRSVTEGEETVSLEANEDFAESVSFGAVPDRLNYPRLIFWSLFGTGIVVITVLAIMAVYNYTITSAEQSRASESQFYNISELEARDSAILDSYGVVDLEEGIYRIPIDSAMTLIAEEAE
ncbi:hypothetical protein [Rhodohalobacter mucosus]|uniref:Uncharacterized protein n=1 Tax=Rhodohalobacter mucosus TaxID=2079485 RepID=A0A316TRU3_9BACT|nr:hypothetical protein [Rhodohalobacter mucosus]PWN07343.1 hypothetical protein DDZ15_03500 [Rhodohalobacter mucosus]